MPPKFFITHSWKTKDANFARQLCNDLNAKGLAGFFDAYSIKPGDRIPEEIERGLQACDIYVPILSYAALESEWCAEEINAAITLGKLPGRKGRPRIIPILIENCQDKMSVFLLNRLYINFTDRYEEALQELLTKGFGLPPQTREPAAREARSSVPAVAPAARVVPFWAWAAGGASVMFVVVMLLLGMSTLINEMTRALTPTAPPTAVAGAPRATSTIPLTVAAVATALPVSPTSAPPAPPTNPATMAAMSTRTATAPPAPPTTVRIPPTAPPRVLGGAEMVYVPACDFTMGSNYSNQKPPHTVYLDSFWIDKFEVTNALYKKCVDAGDCSAPSSTKSGTRDSYYGNLQYDNYPVIYVSWNDANAFCSWASKRLPTEAEWEKAARGTDSRMYPWGNEFDDTKINEELSFRPGVPEVITYKRDTTEVGKYRSGASPYGALDMAGNVWEWVADWYADNYYSSSPRNNPKGPSFGQSRVRRGGSWHNAYFDAWTTSRDYSVPDARYDNLGFRCAQ